MSKYENIVKSQLEKGRCEMTEDSLIIGYDNSDREDYTTLVVARSHYPRTQLIKVFSGEEAQKIYELLTHIEPTEPKKQNILGTKFEQIKAGGAE